MSNNRERFLSLTHTLSHAFLLFVPLTVEMIVREGSHLEMIDYREREVTLERDFIAPLALREREREREIYSSLVEREFIAPLFFCR